MFNSCQGTENVQIHTGICRLTKNTSVLFETRNKFYLSIVFQSKFFDKLQISLLIGSFEVAE